MNTQLIVGEEIFLDIKRIGINGEGIGYYKRLAIFVNGVLPKENVLVKITKLHKGYAEAEVLELKTPSKDRVEPFCPYYTKCGGCSLQHVSYEATRDIKRDILMESITRYTKINPRSFEVKPTILMENPRNYRAKVNLPAKNGGKFYQKLAAYGHLGRTDLFVPWEQLDKVDILKKSLMATTSC